MLLQNIVDVYNESVKDKINNIVNFPIDTNFIDVFDKKVVAICDFSSYRIGIRNNDIIIPFDGINSYHMYDRVYLLSSVSYDTKKITLSMEPSTYYLFVADKDLSQKEPLLLIYDLWKSQLPMKLDAIDKEIKKLINNDIKVGLITYTYLGFNKNCPNYKLAI